MLISKNEHNVIAELESLNFDLNDARHTVSLLQKDVLKIDRLINENRKKSRELAKKIGQNETYASQRIVALYKLNQL